MNRTVVLQPAKRTPPNISRSKNSNTQRTEKKTTDVVIHQHSRRLLKMDILMSETCWAHNKWNKIASDIKLVFYSSTQAPQIFESLNTTTVTNINTVLKNKIFRWELPFLKAAVQNVKTVMTNPVSQPLYTGWLATKWSTCVYIMRSNIGIKR